MHHPYQPQYLCSKIKNGSPGISSQSQQALFSSLGRHAIPCLRAPQYLFCVISSTITPGWSFQAFSEVQEGTFLLPLICAGNIPNLFNKEFCLSISIVECLLEPSYFPELVLIGLWDLVLYPARQLVPTCILKASSVLLILVRADHLLRVLSQQPLWLCTGRYYRNPLLPPML